MLKTWKGEEGNVEAAQQALLKRAKANSEAQLGKYDPSGESADAAKGMFEKGECKGRAGSAAGCGERVDCSTQSSAKWRFVQLASKQLAGGLS